MTPPFGNDNMDINTEGISAALLHVVDAETKVIGEQITSSMTVHRKPQQSNSGLNIAAVTARRDSEERQGGGVNPDVGELVVKAKKAAASLWMILHAQNCCSENCPYPQCAETQTLLEHVQSCSVSTNPSSPCPTSCKGCNETRKLLAHYHKCKEMRSNQSTNQNKHPQQGSCLVCSLMARYAKNVTVKQQAAKPPPKQRPRSESYPELKSPERKSRQVKFAPCLRTTRYYHPDKDKSYCVARRPRSFSLGSNVSTSEITEEEEENDRNCSDEIVLPGSL